MPGIVGILSRNLQPEHAETRLSAMLGAMLHQSFYSHGVYSAPRLGCYLGWVSHPRSYSDCNPIVGETSDVAIVFSGEHFGESSRGAQPTGLELLELYRLKGEAFLLELNGWFGGVIIDRRQGSVTVFNDRYGMHHVYYTEEDDSFVFASEAKAILTVCPSTRNLDRQALGQFLAFGHTVEDRTLFTNVRVMPRGSSWQFGGAAVPRRRRYFDVAAWEQQAPLPDDDFYAALKAAVTKVVPRHFASRAGTAMSLTGGLDTRIIMAARPPLDAPTPCYTYGGFYRNCYDVQTAAEVTGVAGQPYQVIPLERRFFDEFATYAERTVYLTDGCANVTDAHELYFSERARAIGPIRLTGNYGSEVLRGVNTFKGGIPSGEIFTPDVLRDCQDALESFRLIKASNEVSFAATQNVPWHLHGRLAVAQSQLEVRSPYMDNHLVALTYRAAPALRKSNELSLRLIRDLSPRLHTIPTDMGYGGSQTAIVGLPRRLVRYATFKAEWYYNLGMPKWLGPLDRPLLRPLSPLFLGWHKIDHMRPWYRDQLYGYLRDMLSDPGLTTRPYVNPRTRAKLLPKTITGRFVQEVSLLLTLELVHRTLLRTPSPARPAVRGRVLASP